MKCKNISSTAIRERLTHIDIHGKPIRSRDAWIVKDIKRVLDAVCEWKRHDCTIIFGGGVITAHKKNFIGRIDVKAGPLYGAYDAVLLDYLKELI